MIDSPCQSQQFPAQDVIGNYEMREAPWNTAAKLPPSDPLRNGGSYRYRTPRCLRHRHFRRSARFLTLRPQAFARRVVVLRLPGRCPPKPGAHKGRPYKSTNASTRRPL